VSKNERFGFIFGGIYFLVGLVGFAVTGGVGFAATHGKELLIFSLNPLHNVVHLAVGALLLLGARGGGQISRGLNLAVGSTYLLVGVVGLFLVGASANIVALNHPDNVLHLATSVLALAVGASEPSAPLSAPSRA